MEYSFKGEEKKRKGRRRERIEVGGISNWSVVAIQVGIRVTSINDLVSGGLKHNGGNIPLQSIHISGRILFTASSRGAAAKVAAEVEGAAVAREQQSRSRRSSSSKQGSSSGIAEAA